MKEHTMSGEGREELAEDCYGCFWDMRPGPWHTCSTTPSSGDAR